MTNYMGKKRLLRLMLHCLEEWGSDESLQDFKFFSQYRKSHGSEWLDLDFVNVKYSVFVSGSSVKLVRFAVYRYCSVLGALRLYERFVTYYDENFSPCISFVWLSVGCDESKLGRFIRFTDTDFDAKKYFCFNISKE